MDLRAHDHIKGLFDRLKADDRAGRITIRLAGGGEINGMIGETGNEAVIIKALRSREFYDAYVRYEHVTCVEVQTRS